MGIIDDGEALYQVGPDGKEEPIYAKSYNMKVGDTTYIDLDEATGTLKISVDPAHLDDFVKEFVGEIPEEGARFSIGTPLGGTAYLAGVRSVESTLEPYDNGEYMLQPPKKG